ncbi:MAG: tetratricopeptide repeat protein, partial [Spirochaetota bacterium]
EKGGIIASFEGDALTILFPIDNTGYAPDTDPESKFKALYSAVKIKNLFEQIGGIHNTVDFDNFTLSVKIGLSYGEVEWGIVGYVRHKTYFFRGEGINNCAEAEQKCKKGQIIFDKNLYDFLDLNYYKNKGINFKPHSEGYYLLNNINIPDNDSIFEIPLYKNIDTENNENIYNDTKALPDIKKEIALYFYSDKIIEYKQGGEFRDVVSVFISFKETSDFYQLNNLVEIILKDVDNFGGYFEGLNFGDKGGNCLVLFGAPISYENNIERAINFILSIKEHLGNNIRSGITYGKVYSGIRGNQIRCTYGVLGDIVNLSARFMMKAEWGDIWISGRIEGVINHKYNTAYIGDKSFKGKSSPIKVYKLIKIKEDTDEKPFSNVMVGRENEVKEIIKHCKGIILNRLLGILYVYGDAGIGKSRLLYEVINRVKPAIKTFILQTDGILKKSMNPFIYFFNNYFNQSQIHNQKRKKLLFEDKFKELIDNLNNLLTEKKPSLNVSNADTDNKENGINNKENLSNLSSTKYKNVSIRNEENIKKIINELKRRKSLLGALLGIHWKDSLYEKLNARGRFENTLFAIKEFFKAESLLKPVIIFVEDIQYIDDDSQKVFNALTWNIEEYPIVIIASSRFNDDGSKPKLRVDESIIKREISLGELSNDLIETIINEQLGHIASKSLINFIISKTKGNPFYIEQFCLYLLENNMLTLKEKDIEDKLTNTHKKIKIYNLKEKNIEVPTTINSILISRIDRLSSKLKEAIQIASVLGNEFDTKVFFEMLTILKKLVEYLSFVIEEEFDMWAFSTIIDKEEIHPLQEEGEMERLWYEFSEHKYIFKHALLRDVAYDMQPRKRLQNLHRISAEAIEKLYNDDETYYSDLAFHYEKAEIRDKTKDYLWKAGENATKNYKNYEALLIYDKLIKHKDDIEEEIEIYYRKGKILNLIGRWNEGIKILDKGIYLAKQVGNKKKEAQLKVIKGEILQELSEYDKSLETLNDAKDISEDILDKKTLGYSLDNIGEIYRLKGEYSKAMKHFQRSLLLDIEIGDKQGASDSLNNIGNIYRHKHNYEKALESHLKSIEIKKEIEDKDGIALAYNNIAIIYWNKGDYDNSLEYLKKSLAIKEEMGNKRGKSISLNNIGIIHRDKGDYDKALDCHKQSLAINEE